MVRSLRLPEQRGHRRHRKRRERRVRRDLSLYVDVTRQYKFTGCSQPYTSTDPETLLNQLVAVGAGSRFGPHDEGHLFTGKDLSLTLGIAYTSVVCSAPSLSYGLTAHFRTFDWVTTAHEMGHTLGAQHVDSGIMQAVLTDPLPTSFSAESQAQIADYIAANGSCLDTVQIGGPTTTPASTSTPAPTPPPGATPTTAPTPTSGGGGSGGSGIGGSPGESAPSISISAGVRASTVQLSIALSSVADGCTTTVLVNSKARGLLYSGYEVQEFDTTTQTADIGATLVPRRVSRRRRRSLKGVARRYYLAARNDCPGRSPAFSSIVSVDVHGLNQKAAALATQLKKGLRFVSF